MSVGLRFRDPKIPLGDKVELYIKPETVPKLKKLLDIVGGKVLFEKRHKEYVHMIVQKELPQNASQK